MSPPPDRRRVPPPCAAAAAIASAALLAGLPGCVWHGPHATARLAPERHVTGGKQTVLTVSGRLPATARAVHKYRLNHGAGRAHVPAEPVFPWWPGVRDGVLGLAVSAGETVLDGPPACRCGRCGGSHPPRPAPRRPAGHPPREPAMNSGEVPLATGSCSG